MNVLVTGVSRGVGLEICRLLLENGHTVYGISRQSTDSLRELQSRFPETLCFVGFDLADTGMLHQRIFKEFVSNKVVLHGLVNNAAVAYDDIVTNLNEERLKWMYAINVFAPMLLTKYVIRNMLLHKTRGSLVHLSSISAHTGYKGLAMYASGKGAMEAFSKNTAREWGALGIRSNVVVPGFMETDMSATLSAEQKERIYSRTSLKAGTDIASVAATVHFLLSDGAHSITGQNVFVDNGTI